MRHRAIIGIAEKARSESEGEGTAISMIDHQYVTDTRTIEGTDVREHTVYRVDDDPSGQVTYPVAWCIDGGDLRRFRKNGGTLVYDGKMFKGYQETTKKVGQKGMIDVTTFEKQGNKTPIIVAGAICGVLAVCGAVVALAVRKRYAY